MNKSLLVRLLGFKAVLIHGDLLVWDRWRWLKRRLPVTRNGEQLLDVGCGSGAFTIGGARRGYQSVGLSWDERNQSVAEQRARLCRVSAQFPIQDVRFLGQREDLRNKFDVVVCFENIEHVLNDRGLMHAMTECMVPGGRLLLTAPYYLYREITVEDRGPFSRTEDGWHVRRGYTSAMLTELCNTSGLMVEEISYCSGFLSQKITVLLRKIKPFALGWLLVLPLRVLPPIFDRLIAKLTAWPDFSICLVAYKPRFETAPRAERPRAITPLSPHVVAAETAKSATG
jgi:SAM-dependent methyltransferase